MNRRGFVTASQPCRLHVVEARGPADFPRAFANMTQARAEALAVVGPPVFDNERHRLVELATTHRLPTVYSTRPYVDVGGLMSYGPDLNDSFRRAATYVDKVLNFPPSLLLRAVQVIE